jgi:hypothetical protein
VDAVSPLFYLYPPARKVYEEVGPSIEGSLPNTYAFRFGRVFGSTVTIAQGITEINLAPTIGGGGTLLSCLTTGAETLGGGCIAGAGVSVLATGAVLVHGLSVTGVSVWNGSQQAALLMSGRGDNSRLEKILNDRGLFLNWIKGNFSESRIGNPLSDQEARFLVENARRLHLVIEDNPAGLQGLEKTGKWAGIPHFKIENIHIPIRLGFQP